MTGRSTRTKLRFQVEKAMQQIDRAIEHLAKIDILAEKQSPYINKNLPLLVVMLEGHKRVLQQFREGL